MNTTNGPLSFDAIINDVNYGSQLDAMERRMLGFTQTTLRESNKLDSQFARLGQLAAGYFSFQFLSQLPAQILRVRGEFESLEISLTTILKSKAKADQLFGEVRDYANTSPFGVKEVATATKQMLAYGFSVNDVIPDLKRLGDISAGLSLPLERLIYLYGTTKTQGRLFAQDLNQFVGSGIPLLGELAKQFGVTEDKVRGLVEEGKIGFAEVKEAIVSMTSGSGLFAGTLEAQSKSINALKERLKDAYENVLNEIGSKNQDLAVSVLTTTTDAIQHYEEFVKVLAIIAGAYGGYRAAVLLANAAQELASMAQIRNAAITEAQAIAQLEAANATGFLTLSQLKLAASVVASSQAQAASATVSARATAIAARAQAALNATMLTNPIVLVGTAIAGLAAAYFILRERAIEVKSAQELLAESSNDVRTDYGKQKAEINTLIGIIRNQNVAESERKKAYDRLNAITPDILRGLDVERAKLTDLTQATNAYLDVLKRRIDIERGEGAVKKAYDQNAEAIERYQKAEENYLAKVAATRQKPLFSSGPDLRSGGTGVSVDLLLAKRELDEALKFKQQATKTVKDADDFLNKVISGSTTKEALQASIQRQEAIMATLDKLSPLYKEAEDKVAGYRQELDRIAQAEKTQQVVKAKTLEQLDAEIKAKKELQGQQSSKAGYDALQKDIDKLDQQRRRITGELTTAEKKAQKEADKTGPYGSVAYWESISQKAREILSKTPVTNTAQIAKQNAILLDAERKAEEARKVITIRSFDEEITYKREQYDLSNQAELKLILFNVLFIISFVKLIVYVEPYPLKIERIAFFNFDQLL